MYLCINNNIRDNDMKKFLDFVKKYFQWIVIVLLIIVWFKGCSIDNECTRNRKALVELTKELSKKDSILDVNLKNTNHKIDSTLISNSAVISSNKNTSNEIKNQKQQQVVVKLIPNKQ